MICYEYEAEELLGLIEGLEDREERVKIIGNYLNAKVEGAVEAVDTRFWSE